MDSGKDQPKTIEEAKQALREATAVPSAADVIRNNPTQSLLLAALAGALVARVGSNPIPASLVTMALGAINDI